MLTKHRRRRGTHLRKVLLDREVIGVEKIGSICFEPRTMWDFLFLERDWIDLRKWINSIPERFHYGAVHVAYQLSQRKTFKSLTPNVRALEYFILIFQRQVEDAYRQGVLNLYGWIIEVQSFGIACEGWDRKVYCKAYSKRNKITSFAFRKRLSLSGLKLRKTRRNKTPNGVTPNGEERIV